MTKLEYELRYGLTTSMTESNRIAASKNFDWINRAKANGNDLTDYRIKMGKAVHDAIMSNPEERQRRSKQLARNNQTLEAKERSRRAAKITSARPEILSARADALAAWREREPDTFYNKCLSKMHSYKTSKPEKWIRDFVQQEFSTYDFKGNQRLMSREYFHLTLSQKRQIDIMSKSHKIIIEVDGYLHFHNVPQWDQLEKIQFKDAELNYAAPKMGYMLVRISYDQWSPNGELNDSSKVKLIHLLSEPQIGLHLIGELYTS